MPSAGIIEKMCDTCRNKVTHRTCAACGKYRKVAGTLPGDRPHCSACLQNPGVSHSCPDCSVAVPGAGNARCRGCQNRVLILRESGLTAHALTHPWVRDLYLRFAVWLHERMAASPRLLGSFRSHHFFFERIDAQFARIGELTSSAMLKAFGPAELRKHLLVMQFLDAALGISIDEQNKADFAEQERIAAKIVESSRHPWGRVVADYSSALAQSEIAIRTQRMYLSAAVAFCGAVTFKNGGPWSEDGARHFLAKKPGNRANLTRFFSFCRQKYGWDVAMPQLDSTKQRPRLPRTVRELRTLLREIDAAGIENARMETLARVIAKSLGLRIGVIMSLSPAQLLDDGERYVLIVNGERIHIPEQLEEIATLYAARLAALEK